jgi:hypothetical protein
MVKRLQPLRLPVLLVPILLFVFLPRGAWAHPSEHPFAIQPGSFSFSASSDQAGAHADWTTTFDFEHDSLGGTFNDLRETVVELPAGFVGSNEAVATCTQEQLLEANPARGSHEGSDCPAATQVGTITLDLSLEKGVPIPSTLPVYNMEVTTPGLAAQLGFHTSLITDLLNVAVRPGDLGLTVTAPDVIERAEPRAISLTTWAIPGSPTHTAERGRECVQDGTSTFPTCYGGNEPFYGPVRPYLANPTSCGSFSASMRADSWEEPGNWSSAQTQVGPITGCERVHFDPSLEVIPTTDSTETASGLEAVIETPQTWSDPQVLATSNLNQARITLPLGYTVNPSAGAGLVGCSEAQYESETASSAPGVGCPAESKLGTVSVQTPLLNESIEGSVYIARPYENPFGTLLALYVVAKVPDRGVVVKLAGRVEADPVTGQLTSIFEDTPQQPFSVFRLKFHQGATSPLVSPPACGVYTANGALSPWADPMEAILLSHSFLIEHGIAGGACPTGGVPSFHPQVISGTQNNAGGAYSPFYLRIDREDGEQEITRFSTTLPPGLTGNLTGIPFCPDANIEAAKAREGTPHGGAEEEAHPSCPAASEIGHTIVEAGVGTVLAQTPGKIYLAGPYHGAPLSIVSITSAKVGPFDLGTVVIRFALDINPTTAQVEVSANGSDPIPHIVEGIVVHVRNIRVYMSREKFILDPTDCTPLSITNTIDGAGADPANPADQVPVTVTTPFTAADCSSLAFKPDFSASTFAKPSRLNGESLTVKLTMPGALGSNSNIHLVKVELPKDLPSRLTTLRKACLASVFEANPAECPPASIIGHAKALTPILPVPLEGPAYFVSHGGEAFPSLIVVLQGYGFTIDLVGTTYISKQGVTSSTFKAVPDQPVTSFELTLPEGPYSALASLGNPCKNKLTMPTEFIAQNGATIHQSTKIAVTGCPKARHVKHKRKKHASRKRAKRRGR